MGRSSNHEYIWLERNQHPRSQWRRACLHGWGATLFSRYTFVSVLCLLIVLFWLLPLYLPSTKAKISLTKDNTFHISVFSDLHYGENEDDFGIEQDHKSTALMRKVLAWEQPDFVILNGDLVTGENTYALNSSTYVDNIAAPLVEGGYSWASTYGNHDSKFNLSREALFAKEKKYAGAYTEHGPDGTDGVTNYVLPVFREAMAEKPVALLWFFDSRGGSEYQSLPANHDNIDDSVSNDTARWFRSAQTKMQVGPPARSFHVPILLPSPSPFPAPGCPFHATDSTRLLTRSPHLEEIRHSPFSRLRPHPLPRLPRSPTPIRLPHRLQPSLPRPKRRQATRPPRLLQHRRRSTCLHESPLGYPRPPLHLLRP